LFGDSFGRGRGASDALLDSLEREAPMTLFTDEWRTPLEVGEAAARCLELLGRREVRGVLHLPGPERLSRHEFGWVLLAVLEAHGVQPPCRPRAGLRADQGHTSTRPSDVCLDGTRARALLGAPDALEVALERAVRDRLA
jgi:dTDP-4-dehydrorhamnose reductase